MKLAHLQLSNFQHYDFGLRNVKAILNAADSLKIYVKL